MKNTFVAISLLAAGLATTLAAQAPAAPAQTKVAVMNVQGAMISTKEGQKAAADLETKMTPRKKELDAKQAEIKDLQDRLQKGGIAMSDSAKEELTRNIDTKTKSYNRQVEDAQAELEQEQQRIVQTLMGKMQQVIDKYATASGYSIILDVSNQNTPVLWASNAVDITKEIIDLYDKTVATPTAAPAKPAAPAAAPAAAARPAAPAAAAAPAPAKKQ